MSFPRSRSSGRVLPALVFIWLVASAFNITKAVHIDDAGYLEMAVAFLANPWHPFSQPLNWSGTAEPIHFLNQPLLWPALLAAPLSTFGRNELALHALMALVTLSAILLFYLVARRLRSSYPIELTATFALGPAFIPSQNLMVDVPIVALWLACFSVMIGPSAIQRRAGSWMTAAAAAGTACLIKYISLAFLPVLGLGVALRKESRLMWTLTIPALMLAGWSAFNYFDYGGFHLTQRPVTGNPEGLWAQVLNWLTCLGAVSPFSVLCVPYLWGGTSGRRTLAAAAACWLLSFAVSVFHGDTSQIDFLLRATFLANGVLVTAATAILLWQQADQTNGNSEVPTRDVALLLGTWFVATALFTVQFSPFMAVRHVLLVVPVFLLLAGRHVLGRVGLEWRALSLAFTVLLGFALGLSDWRYADVYRQQASVISRDLSGEGSVWYVGHWGWQWYATGAGMRQYDNRRDDLGQGDYVILPDHMMFTRVISARHLPLLREMSRITVPSHADTLLRTMFLGRGYYSGGYGPLPWTLSREPLEGFTIFKVERR